MKLLLQKFAVAPLHWIISDNEEAIVVEVSKQYGMKVFEDKLGVLTNSPDFNWQVTNLGNYTGLSPHDATVQNWNGQEVMPWGVGTGSLGLPGDSIPASRFAKVAYLNANYPTQKGETANVAKFFNILKSVAMVKGSVINNQGKDEKHSIASARDSKPDSFCRRMDISGVDCDVSRAACPTDCSHDTVLRLSNIAVSMSARQRMVVEGIQARRHFRRWHVERDVDDRIHDCKAKFPGG